MHKTLFLSLLCLTVFLGCTKKKKDTSPYTSSEYFTCFVNGQEWVAQSPGGPNNPAAVRAEFYPPNSSINIYGTLKAGSTFQTIFISADSITGVGSYSMYFTPMVTDGFFDYNPINCDAYYYDNMYEALLNISEFDQNQHRISGTFKMILRNPNCLDSTMTITNGHFSTSFQ